jgi:hypothetical protein
MTASAPPTQSWLLPGAVGLLVLNLLFLGVVTVWLGGFRADLAWATAQQAELDTRDREARQKGGARSEAKQEAETGSCQALLEQLLALNATLEQQGLPAVPDAELAPMLEDAGCSAGMLERDDREGSR